VVNAYYANDLIASQTIEGLERQTWTLDALGRFNQYKNEAWVNGAWQEAVTKVNHYDSDSDSPAWISEDASLPDEVTRYVDGLDGNLAMQTGKSGARVLQLIDMHGDVMTTLPIRDGDQTADWTALRQQTSDEFGNPTDLTTGGRKASTGASPGKNGRYGWLGGKQRSADALAGVILMGVRLYDPATGRFWSIDPEPGGNATAYDYCSGDPVNCTDLDGRWSFKSLLKKVAKVAEVVSNIPGPIGAAAAAVSAGAYAATGNRGKAIEMGISAAAAMLPGGRAAVKAGAAAIKLAGSAARAAGRNAMVGYRLQKHVRAAAKVAKLTTRQTKAVERNEHLRKAFMGERIDTEARKRIMADPYLKTRVQSCARFHRCPDFVDRKTGRWYDITTARDWQRHASRYSRVWGSNARRLAY
jgi:RHS repeat-associated protein